ncbi:putative gibberellin-regulated protein 6-like [Capsicum annuum]|nr:putative gibberellin-regulated protein 6-like [Capsicum annuum]
MEEHLVLCVDHLTASEPLHSPPRPKDKESSGGRSDSQTVGSSSGADATVDEGPTAGDEEEPLLQTVECRICQEEDSLKNLEIPCGCSGSLKYAHRKCVQRWCDEKGDITCEICHQLYQPGYTAPPPPPQSDDTSIDVRGWTVGGAQVDLNDPRLLAMAAAERRLLDADYDEYADSNASGAAFCRSAALILMALLLLRHALTVGNGEEDEDDISTFFSLFLLRAAGFLLPCYIIAWAISMLQRRRQRQEAAALAAAEVAFLVQAGQHRGLHATIAPGPAPPAEPSTTPGRATTTPQEAMPPEQVATPHLQPV